METREDDSAARQDAPAVVPVAPVPQPPSAWNVANALTVVRLLLVPVFVVVLFVDDGESAAWRWAAFAVFVIAAVTDQLDGRIARKYGLVTDFGKIADPIADKALIGAALVGIVRTHAAGQKPRPCETEASVSRAHVGSMPARKGSSR